MYQVQHIIVGEDHFIVFRELTMPGPYEKGRTMANSLQRDELTRVKCTVGPLDKKARHTKIFFRTGATGEREVREVQVAGESVKYVL